MQKKNNERERGTTFKAIKSSLTCIQSILKLLFPPADAPVEVTTAAQERRKSRVREVTARLSIERKTLGESVRRYHRLSERSTPRFARADTPDEWIPEDIEQAQETERGARRAQKALMAAAKESPRPERELDTAFKSVESLLFACIQPTRDLLPPADAPVEVTTAAQERRKSRVREVIALWTEELLTLKEIERYRRLLSEQSTAIPDWTNGPDVYLSEPIEDARLLKKTSKRDRDKSLTHEKGSPKEETSAE
jgi:hypothetical protein